MADRPTALRPGRLLAGAAAIGLVALTAAACTASSGVGAQGRTSSPAPSSAASPGRPAAGFVRSKPTGRVVTERIPGGATGFAARDAEVYLPPVLATHPSLRLPLLLLLHGTPGSPDNWVQQGHAKSVLDAFAAAHGGRAPVVVMPDINGTEHGDSECVRTPSGGNVEDYLLHTVPDFAVAHLPVTRDRAQWAVAGNSEGGTCSLVLALRAYPGFHVFGDFSGLRRLTVGDTDDPADTITTLFGGSRRAYDRHDPTYLLARHRYPALSGWFECGRKDTVVCRDQSQVSTQARRARIDVRSRVIAGGHDWRTWNSALHSMLPWLWARIS